MIKQKAVEILSEILSLDPTECSPSFLLTKQNGVEPIDIAELCIALEAAWGITLHDEQVSQWRRLSDAIRCVEQLLEEGQAEPLQREDEDRIDWYYE